MIRAIHFPDHMREAFDRHRTPGSFMLERLDAAGLFKLIYFCPCGCGMLSRLQIGESFKPGGDRPSWRWNGSKTEPTLDPSVNHVDHWHGWLRDGYWVVAS
jgi:hypothetical protein